MEFGTLREGAPRIATSKVKWDWKYQKERGIDVVVAKGLPEDLERRLDRLGKRVYRVLNLSGYARVDVRLSEEGSLFVLEANPNPDLGYGEELCEAAAARGISYEALLQRILNLGIAYQAEWRKVMVQEGPAPPGAAGPGACGTR